MPRQKQRCARKMSEDAVLLTLKLEEGVKSQGQQVTLEAEKVRTSVFHSDLRKNTAHTHLGLRISELQDREPFTCVFFKPLR